MHCQTKCEDTYKHERSSNPQRRYEEQEEEREEDNPYVFGRERLQYEIQSDRGYVKVLDKFHEKSKLLLGIANYSISLLVADPRTFVTPVHFDADCVCYVVEGTRLLSLSNKYTRVRLHYYAYSAYRSILWINIFIFEVQTFDINNSI